MRLRSILLGLSSQEEISFLYEPHELLHSFVSVERLGYFSCNQLNMLFLNDLLPQYRIHSPIAVVLALALIGLRIYLGYRYVFVSPRNCLPKIAKFRRA